MTGLTPRGVTRRGLAGLAGGTAATAAVPGRAVGALRARDWQALARSLAGDLLRPGDEGYGWARRLEDPRHDAVRPAAVVRARGTADVAEAVAFARRFGLPLRPRGGGHSYTGDSTVADGLVVDLRPMRAVRYDAGTRQVRVGAGATTGHVTQRLADRGRALPVGTCPGVGLTGLALGGGLGVDSRRHGLTCDAVTGLTLVTADGRVRRPGPGDGLFWAARGGGAGMPGVVTSLRLRTHPARAMGLFAVVFRWEDAEAAVRGWGRYSRQAPRTVWCNLELSVDPAGERLVRVMGRCPPGEQQRRAADVERAVGRDARRGWTGRKPFLGAVAWFAPPAGPRTPWVAGSDVVAAVSDDVAGALPPLVAGRAGSGTTTAVILDPLTGAVQDRGAAATAFPWRRHDAELQWHVSLPVGAGAAEIGDARAWVARAHRAVAGASVGAYANRVEAGRPARDYVAGNLGRLRRLRDRHDPRRVLGEPAGAWSP